MVRGARIDHVLPSNLFRWCVPGQALHIRTRQESWLISLPEELQSDELLRAITSGEVNCSSGSCEPFDWSSSPSKLNNRDPEYE